MATVQIIKGKVTENSSAALLARVVGIDGTPITAADVTSLTLRVYDAKTGTLIVPAGSVPGYTGTALAPADVVIEGPDDDPRWTNTDPHNLEIDLHGSHWPEGGKVYQCEVKVVPVTGDPYYLLWQLTTTNIWSE